MIFFLIKRNYELILNIFVSVLFELNSKGLTGRAYAFIILTNKPFIEIHESIYII